MFRVYANCIQLKKKNLLKTGQLIHVYGWIITGKLETFDFDAEHVDR